MSTNDDTCPLTTPLITTTTITVDEMLREYAGEFGTWQRRHFALTSIAWALNAFHTLVVVFADREPSGFAGPSGYSTVSEWGLVGAQRFKVGFVQSAFFAGSMIGAGMFGQLSDRHLGRKGTLTLTSSMNAILGILTAFSPNFPIYASFRFLTGVSTGGIGLSAFILATEPIGPTKRGPVAMSTFYFFSLGAILLSLTAMFIPQWHLLYIASSIPSLLFVLFALPFISESPRWYLVHGNIPAAMTVMRSIAKSNCKQIPHNITLTFDYNKNSSTTTVIDVLKSPTTRSRLALSVMINFLLSVAYYGLTLNVKNLSTDICMSVMLNAVSEIPAYALTAVLVKGCGRRAMIVSTLGLATMFCGVASVSQGVVRTGCGMMRIFAVTATFNLVFIYTAELFPTSVRNTTLGWVSQAGQTGAVVAPMVVVLGRNLPFGVFGVCTLVGGVLGFGLPETVGQPLYETMEGMEKGERENASEKDACYFDSALSA